MFWTCDRAPYLRTDDDFDTVSIRPGAVATRYRECLQLARRIMWE